MLDKTLRTERDIEFYLGVPTLALVPTSAMRRSGNSAPSGEQGRTDEGRSAWLGIGNMFENFSDSGKIRSTSTPILHYLYQTPNTQEAMACLTYAIQRRKGFALLTGEVGTGKTTLLNKLLDWLRGEQLATAFIFNPRLDANQFLEFAMADFGIETDSQKKSQALLRLNQWLLERYRVGETAVLIVDEAQNLSLEVLEEIRLLTNLETSTEKLLQIVLSGQPELEHMLKAAATPPTLAAHRPALQDLSR